MLNWLKGMDRRWIFLAMLLTVTIPIAIQKTYPEATTQIVQDAFDTIESLPSGSRVLFAMDYDPGSKAELHPMAEALTRHCCEKGHKIIYMSMWPGAGPLVDSVTSIIETEFADTYVYGRDYTNLGFKAGNEMVIKVIADDLRKQFQTDKRGNNLDSMDVTRGLKNIQAVDLVISVSAGTPGAKEWVQQVGNRFHIPVIAGSTGVQATQLYPYYPNQTVGLLAAIKGAAEFEAALVKNYPRYAEKGKTSAIQKMAPQLWGHLLMIFLIILGNVVYFLDRQRGGRQ